MGVVLGIPIFGFLIFGPAFFVLRSNKGTTKQRVLWAVATVATAFALACVVGLFVHIVGISLGLSALERKFGWLENVSILGTVGFFVTPWIVYTLFKAKFHEQRGGDAA